MKKWKRGAAALLITTMALGMTACGGKDAGSSTGENASSNVAARSKEYVYSQQLINVGADSQLNFDSIMAMRLIDGRIYIAGQNYSASSTVVLENFNTDGSDLKVVSVPMSDDEGYNYMAFDENGDLYAIHTQYSDSGYYEGDEGDMYATEDVAIAENEDGPSAELVTGTDDDTSADSAETENPDATADVNDDPEAKKVSSEDTADTTDIASSSDVREAVKISSSTGEIIATTPLGEDSSDPDEYYVQGAAYSSQYGYVIADNERIDLFSKDDLSLAKQVDLDDSTSYVDTVLCDNEGNIYVTAWGSSGTELYPVSVEENKFSDPITMPDSAYNCYPGNRFTFYYSGDDGVYGFDVTSGQSTKLMDFIDSDTNISWPSAFAEVSDSSFILSYSDGSDAYLGLYTKVDPKDVQDRQVLTLGLQYLDYNVRKQVVAFNQENSDYRISIVDYSKYNTEDAYQQDDNPALKQLNNDIVSGNIPDILILDSDMPTESYMAKGLFKDLDSYMSNDSEIAGKEYLTNVFDAFRYKGKLYSIVPSFHIFTAMAKKSIVGDISGWTVEEAQQMAKKIGIQDKDIFAPMDRNTILNYAIAFSGDDFIDWDALDCHFDSKEFKDLLAFVNEFPEEADYDKDTSDAFRTNSCLADIEYIYDFESYNRAVKGVFGEDVALVGFPTASRGGSVIAGDLQLAISDQTKNPDGCWQFVRRFLLDDFQNYLGENYAGSYPTSKTALNTLAQRAMEKPYYTDENGKKIEYDDTYYINGQEIVITPMSQAEVDSYISFMEGLSQPFSYNTEIFNIIQEEAAPYFAGQKSVDDVASIIQSKIKIYVNEIS